MTELWETVDALDEGRAFVDRSSWRTIDVRGADARRWLGDLLTADVASLAPGPARRSLLLTPTGRIRADLWVAASAEETFVLAQPDDQPEPVATLLAPYVLSSAVELDDRTDRCALLELGDGALVVVPRADAPGVRRDLAARGVVEAGDDAVEARRVARGDPRMGVDFEAGALPAEAGLEWTIDITKGCFLGQESVARIRNLGHPPTALRHLRAAGAVAAGDALLARDGSEVGRVTSVAPSRDGGTVLLARVRWSAVAADVRTADGATLLPNAN